MLSWSWVYIWIFIGTPPKVAQKGLSDGLLPSKRVRGQSSDGGIVYALQPDVFTLIEFYLFKVALLIIFIAGLYRFVRKEVRRD